MGNKLIYEMPEKEKLVEIIDSIPSNWPLKFLGTHKSIIGTLYATKKLYEENKIAKNTRLDLARLSEHQMIVEYKDFPFEEMKKGDGVDEYKKYGAKPDFIGIFCNNKMYSSVSFDYVGFEGKPMPFRIAKEIVKHFIKFGYKGIITMYNGLDNEHGDNESEHFHFDHSSGKEHYCNDVGCPHISLEWKYDVKNLDQIIGKIKELGLKEIKAKK